MGSLALLHIAQTAVQVTAVAPALLGLAAAAMALALTAIWLPRPRLRAVTSGCGRRRIGRSVLTALVFLALLPSVVPYDHLFTRDAHVGGESEAVHTTHCHVSPGTCSDAPISAGPGQLLMSDPLIVAPAMLAVLLIATGTVLIGVSVRPEIRPPLRLTV